MVRPERFELPAFWFVARRSIQLSYGRTAFKFNPNCSTHYIQLVSASGGLYPAELRAHCVINNLRLDAFRSTACVVGTILTKIAVRDGVIVAASQRFPQISAGIGLGKDHRIPLVELKCMSPKRVRELDLHLGFGSAARRRGEEPGRARPVKLAHGRRPLFRPAP